jgi:hypothetical protein
LLTGVAWRPKELFAGASLAGDGSEAFVHGSKHDQGELGRMVPSRFRETSNAHRGDDGCVVAMSAQQLRYGFADIEGLGFRWRDHHASLFRGVIVRAHPYLARYFLDYFDIYGITWFNRTRRQWFRVSAATIALALAPATGWRLIVRKSQEHPPFLRCSNFGFRTACPAGEPSCGRHSPGGAGAGGQAPGGAQGGAGVQGGAGGQGVDGGGR